MVKARPAAIVLALLILAAPALADVLTGEAIRVHDGDTLTLSDGTKIRLFGIDAPELKQQCMKDRACTPCGEAARDLLRGMARGELQCERRDKSYDRVVARCSASGVDLALAMIEAGQAIVYGRYIKKRDPIRARYLDAEATARKAGKGVWGETIIPPEDWRRHKARLQCERSP